VIWCSDSLDDLIEKIDYYLLHTAEREAIAQNAKEHLTKYHLNTKRAETLLEIAKKVL
jgi:spore maturation protein CgeB